MLVGAVQSPNLSLLRGSLTAADDCGGPSSRVLRAAHAIGTPAAPPALLLLLGALSACIGWCDDAAVAAAEQSDSGRARLGASAAPALRQDAAPSISLPCPSAGLFRAIVRSVDGADCARGLGFIRIGEHVIVIALVTIVGAGGAGFSNVRRICLPAYMS